MNLKKNDINNNFTGKMIDAFSKICVCVCVDVVYGSMCPKRFKDFRESKFCFFWEIKKRKYKSTKTNDGKKTDIVCLFAALNKTENTIWNHENKIKWYKWIGQICPGLTRLISDMRKSPTKRLCNKIYKGKNKQTNIKIAFSGTKNTKVYIRFLNEKRNKKYSGSWLDFLR